MIEKVHNDLLQKITRSKKSTAVRELGRYPLKITITAMMVGFWNRLIHGKSTKLSFFYTTVSYIHILGQNGVRILKTFLSGLADLIFGNYNNMLTWKT